MGKIINEEKIDDFVLEKYKIPNQVLHRTIAHTGIADLIGLEDYDAYQLEK